MAFGGRAVSAPLNACTNNLVAEPKNTVSTGAHSAVAARIYLMSHQEFDISDGRIADQLRGAAVEFAAGKKTQEEFVGDLLALEARKLRPYGLTLAVSQTADGWLAVVMKHSATGRLCAAFEFLPEKPQFRRFSRLSEYPPVLRSRPSRSGALRTTGRSLS